MKKLIKAVRTAQKTPVKAVIDGRMKEFRQAGKSSPEAIFSELCFCLMTANFNAQRSIDIQKSIGKGFLAFSEKKLAQELKKHGHRFPNTRAGFIVEARKIRKELNTLVEKREEDREFRRWLKESVKGLGYKEASHFLRNIGRGNCAIIDFHIIDLLVEHGLIREPKTISAKVYHEAEKVLETLAKKLDIDLAELDLYLWYLETGKVLK